MAPISSSRSAPGSLTSEKGCVLWEEAEDMVYATKWDSWAGKPLRHQPSPLAVAASLLGSHGTLFYHAMVAGTY